MALNALSPGQVAQHEDARGKIYQLRIHGNTSINAYFTRAGGLRSGDVHTCAQHNIILAGSALRRVYDPASGAETVARFGTNEHIVTPAGQPHLFEFDTDNALLEWWDCPYRAWFYAPYRERVTSSMAIGPRDPAEP